MDHIDATTMGTLLARDDVDNTTSAQKLLDLIRDPFSGEVRSPSLSQSKPSIPTNLILPLSHR